MPENDRKPSLRFKGFTYAWEQCELGNIGTTYTGLSGKNSNDFGHGEGKYVTYLNVFGNPISNSSMVERVELDNSQNQVAYGDVFFTTSSETPEEVGMSSIWLNNDKNTYLNSFCFGFRPKTKVDPYYLAYMLRSPGFRSKMQILAQGISRYNISKSRAMELPIMLPSLQEQAKIGMTLEAISNLITLHQHKYDKLVSVKKALLDKMFPENGNDVPKVRFKGFTDAWEQCELGDLTDLYVGSSFTQELSDDGKFIVMDMGSVSQDGFRVELKRTNIERDMLKKDDLVMPKDDIGGGLIIAKTAHIPTENTHLLGDHVFRLRFFKEDGLFMHYLINSNKVNSNLKKKVTGSAQLGIRGVNVKNEIVNLPSVEEQAQIGDLFNNIDTLITLHQRKHEKLQNIKKALLSKMFA
jgi:type I restriction enzyme S subunit